LGLDFWAKLQNIKLEPSVVYVIFVVLGWNLILLPSFLVLPSGLHIALNQIFSKHRTHLCWTASEKSVLVLLQVPCNPQGGVWVVRHQLRPLWPDVYPAADRHLPRDFPQSPGQQLALREHNAAGLLHFHAAQVSVSFSFCCHMLTSSTCLPAHKG
jgi:hypothetical protein